MTLPIYTVDLETDPFKHGREPVPFLAGLYTGEKFYHTWGNDCIEKMHKIILNLPQCIIYMHNGGKFDMYYCMDWIAEQQELMIISGRIVRAKLWRNGPSLNDPYRNYDDKFSEFRDSFAIMPFALSKYKKLEVKMELFEKDEREANKETLIERVKTDCIYLHELCVSFHDRFGDNLTIGGTSMKELKKLHKFERLNKQQDESIRVEYYYGGRVQCFESGIVKPNIGEKIICYDMNQCYPHSMKNFLHPISEPISGNEVTSNTYFVKCHGRNHNAFPKRAEDGLHFNVEHDTFTVSIHEFNAATETGLFECEDILSTIDFEQAICFDKFVDKFHGLRRESQLNGDAIGALFYKFVGNSAYGKFAQSPDNYFNYIITDEHTNMNPTNDPDGYEPLSIVGNGYMLWKQKSNSTVRYNVATGASITGAARSQLIRAIAKAQRPIYCDTDSIVCESLKGVEIDDTKIGAWKIEKIGDKIAIAGRKMYAIFDGKECVKMASKGVHLTSQEILNVANGGKEVWLNDAPTFDFKTHTVRYISRNVRLTA